MFRGIFGETRQGSSSFAERADKNLPGIHEPDVNLEIPFEVEAHPKEREQTEAGPKAFSRGLMRAFGFGGGQVFGSGDFRDDFGRKRGEGFVTKAHCAKGVNVETFLAVTAVMAFRRQWKSLLKTKIRWRFPNVLSMPGGYNAL